MRKIFLFMMISLDGFFEGVDHDLSWHNVDAEFNEFAADQMKEADTILFGKITYQLMESFWPTYQPNESADPNDAIVAHLMNTFPKVVVSSTLGHVTETENWKNVKLISENVKEEIKKLKNTEGKSIAILGSNKLLVSLTKLGLIDEFRIMINPVVINKGAKLFEGLEEKLNLKLTKTREFKNGNILLYYKSNIDKV